MLAYIVLQEDSFAKKVNYIFIYPDSVWGDWFSHVTDYWSALKNEKNVHFVFFEEMRKVCDIITILGVNSGSKLIRLQNIVAFIYFFIILTH